MRYTAIIDCPGSLILQLIFSHQSGSEIRENARFEGACVRDCSHSAVLFNNFIEAKSFKKSVFRSENMQSSAAGISRRAWPLKADESLRLIAFLFPLHPYVCARTSCVRRMLHESSAMSLNAALVKWILRSCLLISGACLLTTESVQHRRGRRRRKITFYYINHSKLM